MTHPHLTKIIDHITTVIELAPAAKKDPGQLADLLCASAEFRVASRMFRGLEPYASEDEKENVKVDSPLDEQVEYTRALLIETRTHFEAVRNNDFDQHHLIALETMLGGTAEMVNNIRQLVAA